MVSATNAAASATVASYENMSDVSSLHQNTFFPESSAHRDSSSHRHLFARHITHRRIVESEQPHDLPQEETTSSSSPSSLAYRFQGHSDMPYYDCTFLHNDSLVLCSRQKGVDIIQLSRGDGNTNNSLGNCLGTAHLSPSMLSSMQTTEHEQYPYLGTKALWSGTAFVTGTRKGSYVTFDTHKSVRSSQWSTTRIPRRLNGDMPTYRNASQQSSNESIRFNSMLSTVLGPVRRATFRSLQSQLLRQQHNPLSHDDNVNRPTATTTPRPIPLDLSYIHPSWDFLETNHHSLLALHVGHERDYVSIHDSRDRGTHPSSRNCHHLFIHQKEDRHRFGFACFVNEHAIATTSIDDKQIQKQKSAISLWDIRHVRHPVDKTRLVHDPIEAFPDGNTLLEAGCPLQDIFLRTKSRLSGIRHVEAIGKTGKLHAVTKCVTGSTDIALPNDDVEYTHWIVDLLSHECRRIHVESFNESESWSCETYDGLPAFAMQQDAHRGGVLACASFRQVHDYQNRIDLSLHRVGSNTTTKDITKKRKHGEEPANKFQSFLQKGRVAWEARQVVDNYGLPSPIIKLAWNEDGSHLVGLSQSSDLHAWGGY